MTDLLTVYDDDQANSFIDCMICDKRIRGDTHYKIHVTTVQHLKKEDALVAQGQIPRQPTLPEWKDIKHYLEYLNLDEPIIGLGSLVQLADHVTDDGKNVLKYKCRMCFVEMDLYSMVAHIVGRKHRQKYLEMKRPDLVTWTDNAQKQPGLVARAKAAVVEKHEGWGTPVPLKPAKVYQGLNLRPSVQQQPYHGQDVHRASSSAEDTWMYSSEEPQGGAYYAGDEYDSGGAMSHQSYPEEKRHQRPYEEAATGGRLSRGDLGRGRPREEYDRGQYSRGDRLVSLDVQEKGYHEVMPKNRFNDKDLRVYRPGGSEYQKKPVQSSQYGAYDDRKSAANPMSMQERSFHDQGKRGTVREMHSRPWDKGDEMQGYPPILESSEYSMDDVPAKRKKKSRFSDATAEEIALVHIRHSNKPIHENQSRGAPMRGKPPVTPPQNPFYTLKQNQFVNSGSNNPKNDSVLDIFNNIQIENMDDARLLKEKLCTVLKEFQAAKSERVGGHTSQSVSDHRGVSQTDQRRDNPDSMYSQNRGFQEPRRYDDDRRGFQEYEDKPRGFRQGEEDPRASRHYEDYPSNLPEARHYADEPRAYPNTRGQENPPNPPERRRYNDDLRQTEQQYEEYPQTSRANAPRSSQETRYYDDRYRGYGGMDSERNWEQQKGRSKESFGSPPAHFQPHSLQDGSRMYVGRAQQRSHQTGEELYDPFQPSSSPPPEASTSTSLDKIASTLLELVSRR